MSEDERKRLNKAIAQALGWTELFEGVLTNASGMEGTTPEGREFQRVPDYAADLNAVVNVLPNNMDIEINTHGGKMITAFIWWYDEDADETHRFQATGATRQEAAACTLLTWATWKAS